MATTYNISIMRPKKLQLWLFSIFFVSTVTTGLIAAYILTEGQFDLNRSQTFSGVFYDMWLRLLHLDVSSDPAIIGGEAFISNGKTIAYFLPFPAIVRGLLAIVTLGKYAIISSILATIVFALFSGLLFRSVAHILASKIQFSIIVQSSWTIFFIVCTPMLALLSTSQVYWESIQWSAAMFMVCAFLSTMVLGKWKSVTSIIIFSISCGLALFTRPNVAVGIVLLFFLTLILSFIQKTLPSKVLIIPSTIFFIFLTLLGTLNYARWGNPLEFAPLTKHQALIGNERGRLTEEWGTFRLDRIPGAFSYYFLPNKENFLKEKPFIQSAQRVHFPQVTTYLDYREASYPITISFPFFLLFSVIGTVFVIYKSVFLLRKKELMRSQLFLLFPIAISAWVPGILLFPILSEAVRYQGDFLPALIIFPIIVIISLLKYLYTKKINQHTIIASQLCSIVIITIISFYLLIAHVLYQKNTWAVPYEVHIFPWW